MDFVEVGCYVCGNQCVGMGYCGFGWVFLLGIWVEVVVVEDQVCGGEVCVGGQGKYVIVVLWWGYFGVVIELVDLVGGCFDQQQGVVVLCDLYCGQQYLFVVVVNVVQFDGVVLVVGGDQ